MSWFTAQLKAAEGLLDAVDKTVSRTVGTLGLAEEDAELAAGLAGTAEAQFGIPRSASSYQPATTSYAPAPSAYSYTAASGAYPAAAPPASGAAAAGFTVKADAPIPFGGRPALAPAAGFASSNGPTPSLPAKPMLAPIPTTVPAPPSYGVGTPPAPAAPVRPAPDAGGYEPQHAPSNGVAGRASETSGAPPVTPPAGPVLGQGPGLLERGEGAAATASSTAWERPAGVQDPAPAGPSATPQARMTAFAAGPAATTPAFEGPPQAAWAAAATNSAGGGPSGNSGGGGAPGPLRAGALPAAASITAPSAPPPPLATSSSLSAPTSATAASAAAVTAAASTLAAATTTAVSHSLSFFNLVLDDPDAPSDAAAYAASGASASAASSTALAGGAGSTAAQVASLTRTCEQLRKRLDMSRAENEQLEDMLARAEVRAQQEAALVASLREEVASLQQARSSSESSLSAQLSVARGSLAEMAERYEASQRSVLVLEGQLAALEESSRRLLEHQTDREGNVVDALRAELAAAESRLSAERKAHQASRAAAAARENDLEQQIAGSTAALGDLTRSLEDANRKCRALEDEVVDVVRARNDMAAHVAALQRQMADAGLDPDTPGDPARPGDAPGRVGSGLGGVKGAAAAAAAELEVLREEVAAHRRAAQLAKQAADTSQAQVASMAAELEALRLSLEGRKDASQLEAQVREMSDMLYLKQTQLERLSAEKAAQQLKTERELEAVRAELAKLTRATVGQGAGGPAVRGVELGGGGASSSSSTGTASHDIIPMDALGEPYRRLARHTKVGKAVKAAANFLDSTASTTSFVLRQYPLVRLAVFAYALLIHLYVYALLARMQRIATHYEAVVNAPV